MSKYTLNLSEICGVVTGHDVNETIGNPFDYIEDIIEDAIPLIFSSRLKVYDNADDKNELLHKILEHYWEYEVCTYTPNDFIRRLNRKMNEIMPYFNQRYESIKAEWDPFIDVSYKTEHTTEIHDITVGDSSTDTAHTGVDKDNSTHRGQDQTTTEHTGDDTTDNDISFTTGRNENNQSVLDGETTNTNSQVFTNTSVTDTDGTNASITQEADTHVVDTDTTDSTTRTEIGRTVLDQDGTVTKNTSLTSSSTDQITDTAGGTSWDYFNDTPQGSINGVQNLDYLTRYEKHTQEGPTNTRNGTNTKTDTGTDSETSTVDTTTTINNSITESKAGTVDTTDTITKSINLSGTTTQDTTLTENKRTTDTGGTTTDNVTTDTKSLTGTDITDGTSKITYNNTVDTVSKLGTDYNTDHIYDSSINTQTDTSTDYKRDGSDDTTTSGKANSGRTYAEMVMLWRDAMINLDMEVIDALHPLFFLIS